MNEPLSSDTMHLTQAEYADIKAARDKALVSPECASRHLSDAAVRSRLEPLTPPDSWAGEPKGSK